MGGGVAMILYLLLSSYLSFTTQRVLSVFARPSPWSLKSIYRASTYGQCSENSLLPPTTQVRSTDPQWFLALSGQSGTNLIILRERCSLLPRKSKIVTERPDHQIRCSLTSRTSFSSVPAWSPLG